MGIDPARLPRLDAVPPTDLGLTWDTTGPPPYVERDVAPLVRQELRRAREEGGFLLVVGPPAVGKTRLLYEVAREVLPDLPVLVPGPGDGRLVDAVARADLRSPLLVWLDEVQRFVEGPWFRPGSTPIRGAAVEALLDAAVPVVLVATIRLDHLVHLRTTDRDGPYGHARYPGVHGVLVSWRQHEVHPRAFSGRELTEAQRLAPRSPRLAAALTSRDVTATEALAGTQDVIDRYERSDATQRAIVHAAVDARRVGVLAPLPDDLLLALAAEYPGGARPGDPRRAGVPHALTEHEPFRHHLARLRRAEPLPGGAWRVLVERIDRPDDLDRLLWAATHRMLHDEAAAARARLTAAGITPSTWASRIFAPESWAPAPDPAELEENLAVFRRNYERGNDSAHVLAHLLVATGRAEEGLALLRAHADAGDADAGEKLAEELRLLGRDQELWSEILAGTPGASVQWGNRLVDRGGYEQWSRLRERGLGPDGTPR